MTPFSIDTDQICVSGCWFGSIHFKVLSGHFLGRLAVTHDGQQTHTQQSKKHPGGLHGDGGPGKSGWTELGQEEKGGRSGPEEFLPPISGDSLILYQLGAPPGETLLSCQELEWVRENHVWKVGAKTPRFFTLIKLLN